MEMEEVARGTDDKANVPFTKDDHDHESLVAYATKILKEESDKEVLKSIVELLQDLKTNAEVRDGLRSFQKYGWAVIRRNRRQKENNDFIPPDTPAYSSSTMLVEMKEAKGKQILDNRLDHEAHPINNELVLKTIFEFSAVNDLKNCRLVCQKWRDLSLTIWRRKAVLHTSRLFKEGVGSAHQGENAAIKKFRKFFFNPERPFQRYNLNFDDEDWGFRFSHKAKKKVMLEAFKSSIQHLFLNCDDLEMLCLLLTTLPELRVLHVDVIFHQLYREYESKISSGRECPFRDLQSTTSTLRKLELDITSRTFHDNVNFPWKKIFQSVPALTSFHLHVNSLTPTYPFEEILQSFCEARKEGNFSILNLEDLRIYPGPGLYARGFAECRFPLQSLYITLEKDNIDNPSSISNLLEALAGTLESLKFIFGMSINNIKLQSDIFMGSCFLPNLKTFYNDISIMNFDATDLRSLAKAMPNLIELSIPLGEGTFPIVYKLWPNLQSLRLLATGETHTLLDDHAIIGSPFESCDDEELHAESRELNITDLKDLKKFALITQSPYNCFRSSQSRRARITDLSAVFGFLLLPQLEILHIETYCKFSANVMVALEEHIPEIKIMPIAAC